MLTVELICIYIGSMVIDNPYKIKIILDIKKDMYANKNLW